MTVVVHYVPTPEGDAALRHGFREAALRDTEVLVVGDLTESAARAGGAEVGADVRVTVADPPAEGMTRVDQVIDASYADHAVVVVLGLRRRSPVGKLIMGSDSQRILLDARCPVTAVKVDVRP